MLKVKCSNFLMREDMFWLNIIRCIAVQNTGIVQVQLLGFVVYHGKQSKQGCYLWYKVTVIMCC